jgi:NAD-dependent SIR2 family protein deacetylase
MKGFSNLTQKLKNQDFKKVGVMVGAGISVNAGIPDFRSKKGLYSTLPSPELIFDIHYFRKNPIHYYEFASKYIKTDISPTITHYFISFLEHKNLLEICYSQNIDGLEKKAGVTRIVQAHGNAEKAQCSVCYKEHDRSKLSIAIKDCKPIYCDCQGPIKSGVVFFGESLPPEFEENLDKLKRADILLVIGTSLAVRPFSSLVNMVGNIPRIVINQSNLSTYKTCGLDFDDPQDFIWIGDSDKIITQILIETGWKDEFTTKFSINL